MIQDEGLGWRLARDSSRNIFSVLLGGSNWAVEITHSEWESLFLLVEELLLQLSAIENQLMVEESISIEMERTICWGCLEGSKSEWSLRLILHGEEEGSRGIEMYWDIPAAQAITEAMRTMWESNQ